MAIMMAINNTDYISMLTISYLQTFGLVSQIHMSLPGVKFLKIISQVTPLCSDIVSPNIHNFLLCQTF